MLTMLSILTLPMGGEEDEEAEEPIALVEVPFEDAGKNLEPSNSFFDPP